MGALAHHRTPELLASSASCGGVNKHAPGCFQAALAQPRLNQPMRIVPGQAGMMSDHLSRRFALPAGRTPDAAEITRTQWRKRRWSSVAWLQRRTSTGRREFVVEGQPGRQQPSPERAPRSIDPKRPACRRNTGCKARHACTTSIRCPLAAFRMNSVRRCCTRIAAPRQGSLLCVHLFWPSDLRRQAGA